MEDSALISQREFASIKTVYILAIIFCVFAFIAPLQDVVINQVTNNPGITWDMSLAILMTLGPAAFFLFCVLFAKGPRRKTLILIALWIYVLYQAVFFTLNTAQRLQFVSLMQMSPAEMNSLIQGMLIYSLIPLFIQTAIQIIITVFFLQQYKKGKTNRATANAAFILLGPLVFWFIYVCARQLASQIPEAAFTVWLLFAACLGMFGCLIFWKFRPLRGSHAWHIKTAFTLFIIVFMAVVFCYPQYPGMTALQIWGSVVGLMRELLPLFFMYIAYKAIADSTFFKYFIESRPETARKKQCANT